MKKWKQLEENVFYWLNKNFSSVCNFELKGKSDATTSDILVTNKTTNSCYYIEIKSEISQAGQFVVIYDEVNKLFYWSSANKSENNIHSQKIINFMNEYKDEFKKVSEQNLLININNETCFEWVKDFYNQKKVKFFIVPYSNSYLIWPIEKIELIFEIKAIYRVKKSGSNSIPRRDFDKIKSLIKNAEFIEENNKFYALVKNKILNNKINYDENDYQYSLIDDFNKFNNRSYIKYELRKLSKTRNPNVIFKINVKKNLDIDLKNIDILNLLKKA